jgi:hypothetical protein
MPRLKTSGAILPPHTPSWRVLGKTSRSTSKTSLQIKRLFAKSVVLLQVSCCPFGIFRFIFIIWFNAETMCDWSRSRVRWGSNGCQNIPLMRIKLKNTSQQDSSNILGQYFVSGVHIPDTWTQRSWVRNRSRHEDTYTGVFQRLVCFPAQEVTSASRQKPEGLYCCSSVHCSRPEHKTFSAVSHRITTQN